MRSEPPDYRGYSDTRPDLTATGAGRGNGLWIGDLKLFGSIGSDGMPPLRGSVGGRLWQHAAACARADARTDRLEVSRSAGRRRDGVWRPRAGVGHVQKCRGQYTRAIANGCTVYTLLFETLGGFSPDVCLPELLNQGERASV